MYQRHVPGRWCSNPSEKLLVENKAPAGLEKKQVVENERRERKRGGTHHGGV